MSSLVPYLEGDSFKQLYKLCLRNFNALEASTKGKGAGVYRICHLTFSRIPKAKTQIKAKTKKPKSMEDHLRSSFAFLITHVSC